MDRKSVNRDSIQKGMGLFGQKPQDLLKHGQDGKLPDINCGLCANFLETSQTSDGRGTCKVLRDGSDIVSDPPVFVTEGKNAYLLWIWIDASKCTKFVKNEFIDRDGQECSDPARRRMMRQFQDKEK